MLQADEVRDVLLELSLPAAAEGSVTEALHACVFAAGERAGPFVCAAAAAAAPGAAGLGRIPDGVPHACTSLALARVAAPPAAAPDAVVEESVMRVMGAHAMGEAARAAGAGDSATAARVVREYLDEAAARGLTEASPCYADALMVSRHALAGDARAACGYAVESAQCHAQQKSVAVSGARCAGAVRGGRGGARAVESRGRARSPQFLCVRVQ